MYIFAALPLCEKKGSSLQWFMRAIKRKNAKRREKKKREMDWSFVCCCECALSEYDSASTKYKIRQPHMNYGTSKSHLNFSFSTIFSLSLFLHIYRRNCSTLISHSTGEAHAHIHDISFVYLDLISSCVCALFFHFFCFRKDGKCMILMWNHNNVIRFYAHYIQNVHKTNKDICLCVRLFS